MAECGRKVKTGLGGVKQQGTTGVRIGAWFSSSRLQPSICSGSPMARAARSCTIRPGLATNFQAPAILRALAQCVFLAALHLAEASGGQPGRPPSPSKCARRWPVDLSCRIRACGGCPWCSTVFTVREEGEGLRRSVFFGLRTGYNLHCATFMATQPPTFRSPLRNMPHR